MSDNVTFPVMIKFNTQATHEYRFDLLFVTDELAIVRVGSLNGMPVWDDHMIRSLRGQMNAIGIRVFVFTSDDWAVSIPDEVKVFLHGENPDLEELLFDGETVDMEPE